ncbi:hypothetical protein Ciccas_011631 [Cichlidogyrus casuarinus]|uniref:Uncharacterized protein n=1 Tax=Cichlidogyrus casuarinus TaxID=1844966 RepID=A0ABD2PSE3_9PLAT
MKEQLIAARADLSSSQTELSLANRALDAIMQHVQTVSTEQGLNYSSAADLVDRVSSCLQQFAERLIRMQLLESQLAKLRRENQQVKRAASAQAVVASTVVFETPIATEEAVETDTFQTVGMMTPSGSRQTAEIRPMTTNVATVMPTQSPSAVRPAIGFPPSTSNKRRLPWPGGQTSTTLDESKRLRVTQPPTQEVHPSQRSTHDLEEDDEEAVEEEIEEEEENMEIPATESDVALVSNVLPMNEEEDMRPDSTVQHPDEIIVEHEQVEFENDPFREQEEEEEDEQEDYEPEDEDIDEDDEEDFSDEAVSEGDGSSGDNEEMNQDAEEEEEEEEEDDDEEDEEEEDDDDEKAQGLEMGMQEEGHGEQEASPKQKEEEPQAEQPAISLISSTQLNTDSRGGLFSTAKSVAPTGGLFSNPTQISESPGDLFASLIKPPKLQIQTTTIDTASKLSYKVFKSNFSAMSEAATHEPTRSQIKPIVWDSSNATSPEATTSNLKPGPSLPPRGALRRKQWGKGRGGTSK